MRRTRAAWKAVKGAAFLFASAEAFRAARGCLQVQGRQIADLLKTGDIEKMEITRTLETVKNSALLGKTVLNDRQKELFFLLLEHTSFSRILAKRIPLVSAERFVITAGAKEGCPFFRLESFGGAFVIVDCTLKEHLVYRWKLRIHNEKWAGALRRIMAMEG